MFVFVLYEPHFSHKHFLFWENRRQLTATAALCCQPHIRRNCAEQPLPFIDVQIIRLMFCVVSVRIDNHQREQYPNRWRAGNNVL